MKKRMPSETERALCPAPPLSRCACGVLFKPTGSPSDNPRKCMTCNRSSWSCLFNTAKEAPNVVPIKRRKRSL